MTNPPKDVLVGGCSFSSGWGFNHGKKDPKIWPNLLGNMLAADVTNVAETGYDNVGIFLKILEAMSGKTYDLILVQVTDLSRVVISPNSNGHRLISPDNISNGLVSDDDYLNFFKVFTVINQPFEHWHRFMTILSLYQSLKTPVRFINGLVEWDENFFANRPSDFMQFILDEKNLPEEKIIHGKNLVNQSKEKINQSLWINLTSSMRRLQIDQVGVNDKHPGALTHKLMAEKIYEYLRTPCFDKETKR
jgi:hypothetical protein